MPKPPTFKVFLLASSPKQHPSLTGKGEKPKESAGGIFQELQGVLAETVLGDWVSCLRSSILPPQGTEGSSVWSWWIQKFVEELDILILLLNYVINSIIYRV